MAEPMKPAPMPRSFLTDMPVTSVNVGLALMSRRSSAIADFWRSCAEVRQPTELMAVQLNYWTQLVDDYQEAVAEGLAQLGGPGQAQAAEPLAKSA